MTKIKFGKNKTNKNENKNNVKIHIGGNCNYLEGWINIDNNDNNKLKKVDINFDYKKALPFRENSVDVIFDESFFKKLELNDDIIQLTLTNFRYILKPNGLLKISTPEMRHEEKLKPWLNNLGFPNVEFCKQEDKPLIIGKTQEDEIKTYDLIFSIGEACACTEILRANKLQDFSYPFDWLFGSTFSGRIDIITSRFKNFLDKDSMTYYKTEKSISKDAYKNELNGLVFNHDFPMGVPISKSFDEVNTKYNRRINRLLDKINAASNVLFVYVEIPNSEDPLQENNIILDGQKKLKEAFPSTTCDILYLKHDANMSLNNYIYEELSENILKVTLFNKSLLNGAADHAINYENVNKLFKNYRLSRKAETITDDIVVINSLIPNKNPIGPMNSCMLEFAKQLPGFKNYTMYPMKAGPKAWFGGGFGMTKEVFDDNLEFYLKVIPEAKGVIKRLSENNQYSFNLAYIYFLAEAYTALPFLEQNKIPFVLLLNPGGGFGYNNNSSDEMLKEVCSSKYFRKVIVNQRFVENYLVEKELCATDKIVYDFSGSVQFKPEDVKTKKLYKKDKTTFDICFVAAKYTQKGVDKGYDLFIESAKELAKFNPDIRFHVVGGFDENEIDVYEIKDKIKFYGFMKPADLPTFYSSMDIYMSPNRVFKIFEGNFDGFPLAAGAMYCGVCGFNADELNMNTEFSEDEIIIIETQVDDIVKKVKYYFNNLDELYEISENGKKRTQKLYDIENHIANRIKLFKSIIDDDKKNQAKKPVLNAIEFHVTEHCNLNCKGCGHFCPLAEEEFTDFNQNRKDMKRMAELFSNIEKINILGGEPLLHKDINEFVKTSRECFPNANINVITNGLLVPKMPETFWKTLNEYSVGIFVSQYPKLETFKEKTEELAKKHNVKFSSSPISKFWKGMNLSGSNDKINTFKTCIGTQCHYLKNGTISVCGMPHHLEHFNKKFNKEIPQEGILDIHDPNMTGQKILEFFDTPIEACKYCKPGAECFDWDISKNEISEWCIDTSEPKKINHVENSFSNNTIKIAEDDYSHVTLNIQGQNNYVEIQKLNKTSPGKIIISIAGDNCKILIKENICILGSLRITLGQNDQNHDRIKNSSLIIGKNTEFVSTEIATNNSGTNIEIGDDCMFSSGITLYNTDGHPIFDNNTGEIINFVKDMIIGNHCWIGANVTILKNTNIADNCIVGWGGVVSKSFNETNCVIAGNPAKIVKKGINWSKYNKNYCNNVDAKQ